MEELYYDDCNLITHLRVNSSTEKLSVYAYDNENQFDIGRNSIQLISNLMYDVRLGMR